MNPPRIITMSNKRSPHWPAMKQKFIEGVPSAGGGIAYPTLEELSREYGLSYPRVRKVAATQRWTEERSKFAAQREQQRRDAVLAEEARNFERFNLDCFTLARAAVRKAAGLLGPESRVRPSDLVSLASAVRQFQVVARVATGLEAGEGAEEAGGAAGAPRVAVVDWDAMVAAARKLNAETDRMRRAAIASG